MKVILHICGQCGETFDEERPHGHENHDDHCDGSCRDCPIQCGPVVPLVLLSDHAAALAERDARIADLRECIDLVAHAMGDCPFHGRPDLPHALEAIANQRALLERAAGALEALGRACIHGAEDHDDVLWIDEVTLARREQCATLAAIRGALK